MEHRTYLILLLLLFTIQLSFGQMIVGQDTLVGNEWIRYDQRYFKFTTAENRVYRITRDAMVSQGISANEIIGSNLRIYNKGKQIHLFVSTNGVFGTDDYIEFLGDKNRGELDKYLYRKPLEDMLHPEHSLYTDKNAYYLALGGPDTPARVETLQNDLTSPPPTETYYLHNESISYTASLNDPYFQVSGGGSVSYSSYMHSEGFSKVNETNSTVQIPALNRFVAGPDATLHVRLTSTNYGAHDFVISLNGQNLDTVVLNDLRMADLNYTIPVSLLTDDNQLKVTSLNTISRQSLVIIELIYPRSLASETTASSFIIEGKPNAQHFLISGMSPQSIPPVIYTADGLRRMVTSLDASDKVEFVWPQTLNDLRLVFLNLNGGLEYITTFEQKSFVDFSGDDTEYVVITHPDLMETGTGSEYIQYRASVAGGGYSAKAYSILDLYDQFGYGIEKHPQSVRNFVEFMHRHWPSAKMIFIIGRAIEYNRSRYNDGSWEEGFFVPTVGRPGSDGLLAATTWNLVPRYPIGRLAIVDQEGIDTYLNKIKEHDLSRFAGQTLEEKEWIKNVMHLGGGKTAIEQNDFKAVLNDLGEDLAKSGYGAKMHFFQKASTDIIGESQSAQILKLLHEGCGLINYLGHSASTTFEFNINDPSEWNNHGRYPVFSAMGCSAGQIHGTIFSLSDNYVQIPNEGAIAFISGSGSQFASALISWARPWYDYIGNFGYGGTLGESILHGLRSVSNFVNPELTGSNQYRYLLEQQTFQGDPAIRMHPFDGPDYLIDRSSVSISPEILTTKTDSFDVTFNVANIGKNLNQTVGYRVYIKLQDGQEIAVKEGTFLSERFETSITVRLPLATAGKAGAFRLLIRLDPDQVVAEAPAPDAENNNDLEDNLGVEGIQFLVLDNVVSAAYPPDFSIVTTAIPELVATSSNAFIRHQSMVMQIDTTALFNSPALLQERFPDHAATLKWNPPFNYVPDRVYYWRVSTDSISPEQGYLWSKRSFIYKPGTTNGWNQSHFHQLTDNTLDRLVADSLRHDFGFKSTSQNLAILNRVQNDVQGLVPVVRIDNLVRAAFFTGFKNTDANVFVVAIDSLTGQYMTNPNPGLYGSQNHLSFDAPAFAYRSDNPASRQAMINFIENIIPSGHYVFFYTYQRPGHMDYFPEQWADDEGTFGKSIFTTIEEQFPSSNIRTLATSGSVPYIVFFQKDRGGIEEHIAASVDDVISLSWDAGISLSEGKFVSPLIGPASKWYSIEFDIETLLDDSGKNILSAWALSENLQDTLWISHDLNNSGEDISAINALQYPFIQLALSTGDSVSYIPSDINHWRVLYEGHAEFVINAEEGFVYHAESLEQGQKMFLKTFVENISDYEVDSLLVALKITGADNTTEELIYIIPHMDAHQSSSVEFQKITNEMTGDYRLLMEVNPNGSIKETNRNNNIGILPLNVRGDELNPILDVTFDGHHILDGDLVASRPVILIELHDENQFLRLDDTTSFAIFLQYPSDPQPRRISFTTDWVKFNPASATGQNIATVELRPEFLEDGLYTLEVVALDANGNLSGENNYRISFEVITSESISHLYNYPNPFSTSTRFVYTLTGEGSPPFYKIQIMSISGQVVREITHTELGPLTVGTHMTDFVWDGTDENGGKLSAGTYLYRIIIKNQDMEDFDRYETDGDNLFKKGWGKLVILR